MTMNRVTAKAANDPKNTRRTMRSYLCNDAELQELRPRLEAAGMVVTVTSEEV